jgi:hypothetical protein
MLPAVLGAQSLEEEAEMLGISPVEREAAGICNGEVVEHVFRGRRTMLRLDKKSCRCQVSCEHERNCEVLRTRTSGAGEFREWCGCPGSEEPAESHTVVVHPPPRMGEEPGQLGEIDCSSECPPKQRSCPMLVRSEVERFGGLARFVNHYTCACLGDGALVNGGCPPLNPPGMASY